MNVRDLRAMLAKVGEEYDLLPVKVEREPKEPRHEDPEEMGPLQRIVVHAGDYVQLEVGRWIKR